MTTTNTGRAYYEPFVTGLSGYSREVAITLMGFGFLAPRDVVQAGAPYVARAEELGMDPIRCASNIAACPVRKVGK